MPDDKPERERHTRADGRADRGRKGRAGTAPGDLVTLVIGGGLLVVLVLLNVSNYESLQDSRRTEELAWEEVHALETQVSELREVAPGRGRAEAWAEILDATDARPVALSGTGEAWGRAFYDPSGKKLLVVLGSLPVDDGILLLAVGPEGVVESRGAIDAGSDGRAVLAVDDVSVGAVVEIQRAEPAGTSVVLRGRIP